MRLPSSFLEDILNQRYGTFAGPVGYQTQPATLGLTDDKVYHEPSVTRRHVKTQPTFPDHFIGRRVLLENGVLLYYTEPDRAQAIHVSSHFAFTKTEFDVALGHWESRGQGSLQVWGTRRHDPKESKRFYCLSILRTDASEPTDDEVNAVLRTFTPYTAALQSHGEVMVNLGGRNVPTYHLVFSA